MSLLSALDRWWQDAGEAVSVTVKREFSEEAGAITDPVERAQFEKDVEALFSHGNQVRAPQATRHMSAAAVGCRHSTCMRREVGSRTSRDRVACLAAANHDLRWRDAAPCPS